MNRTIAQLGSTISRPSIVTTSLPQRLQQQGRDWTCPRCRVQAAQQRRKNSGKAASKGFSLFSPSRSETLDQRTTIQVQQYRPLPDRYGRLEDEALVEYANLGPAWEEEMKPRPRVARPVRLRYRDEREEVSSALVARCPEALLHSLEKVVDDGEFIAGISNTQFTSILELLDPEFIVREKQLAHYNLHKPYKAWFHEMDLQHTLNRHVKQIKSLMLARLKAGKSLGVGDYRAILKVARAAGSKGLAEVVWGEMIARGVAPDIDCYKHLMGSLLWNGYHADDGAEGKLRHTNTYLSAHSQGKSNKFSKGYKFSIGPGGIKSQIDQLQEQMIASGLKMDEELYIFRMIAAAREGQLDAVKSVLQKQWGIYCSNAEEGEVTTQKPTSEHTFGFDSPRFLHAIVHCFCTNNDLATAIQLIGYISRTHSVIIPSPIWSLLFEWTFILSKRHYGRVAQDVGQSPAPFPEKSLVTLWSMISSSSTSSPNPPMFNRLISRLYERGLKDSFVSAVRLALGCHKSSRSPADSAVKHVEEAKEQGWPEHLLQPLRKKVQVLEMIRKRNHKFVRRWIEQALALTSSSMGQGLFWESRALLKLLRDCQEYLPEVVSFYTATGQVVFRSRSAAEVVVCKPQQARVSVRRLQAAHQKAPTAALNHWNAVQGQVERVHDSENGRLSQLQREQRLAMKIQEMSARGAEALQKRRDKELVRGQEAQGLYKGGILGRKVQQETSTESELVMEPEVVPVPVGQQSIMSTYRAMGERFRKDEDGSDDVESGSHGNLVPSPVLA